MDACSGSAEPTASGGSPALRSNRPFDPADASTYPVQYIRFVGEPASDLNSRLYTLFVQDQWKPLSNVTFNLGVRWD